MSIEAKKIEIIEAVLQMKNEEELTSLLNNFQLYNDKENKKNDSILSVAGSLSDEDGEEMKQIIEDHFEKIDLHDWK